MNSLETGLLTATLLLSIALACVGVYLLCRSRTQRSGAIRAHAEDHAEDDAAGAPQKGTVTHCKSEEECRELMKKCGDATCYVLVHEPWCGFCKKLMAMLDQVAGHLEDGPVLTVEGSQAPQLCKEHGISGFPVMLRVSRGKTAKVVGLVSRDAKGYADKVRSAQ